MELMWAVAADAPRVVLETNFRPRSEYERQKLTGLAEAIVEVHCACPPELALRRFNERGPGRHEIHVDPVMTPQQAAQWDRPVGIGTLVTVDTSAPVDVVKVAAEVRRHLG